MATITYNANGGVGQVPVDTNTYAANAPVIPAVNDPANPPHAQNGAPGITTGTLSRPGATFLYWNTAADGSGAAHGNFADANFTFPGAANLTLYAQWAITTGLTAGGLTAHYQFSYDQVLGGPGGVEPARTNAVIAQIEADFAWMQAQFAGVDITNGITPPILTYITALGGPGFSGSWWPLVIKPGRTAPASLLRLVIVLECVEMFMKAQDKGWGYSFNLNNEGSCGEALSWFLCEQFQLSRLSGLITSGNSNNWLNSALPASNPASTELTNGFHYGPRTDYINTTLGAAGNNPATGCGMLFLYYLFHQLGFSIPAIIAAAPGLDAGRNPIGGACLRGVFRNLTGDDTDPFPYFAALLAQAFPPDQVAAVAGSNGDDPWPLGSLAFLGGKNLWGHDEVLDIIAKGGKFADAIFLALDGFNLDRIGAATPAIPTIAFGGVTALPTGTLHQSANTKLPQQILFAYDLRFAQPLGAFPASGETPVPVTSAMIVLGKNLAAATEFFFLAGADPYFTNVVREPANPGAANAPWLSEDLRVFTATPGAPGGQTPVPGGPTFVENGFDTAGAYAYLQALLIHLNQTYGDPSGTDPFEPGSNVIPQQDQEFSADSSVVPFTIVGGVKHNNYSFAIARVRLKGSQGPAGAAAGVKVFFRLWGTQSADTQWDPSSTYLSQKDAAGLPQWPLAPAGNHTIPMFATSTQPNFASPADPEFKAGGFTNTGANNLTITIAQGDSQWAYFGCFLDVNDPAVKVNGTPIWQAFPGTHHCLVAEIAYANAPIQSAGGITPTPGNSDQLAQRNLQVTASDNPGPAAAHRVPQTFVIRPSPPPPVSGVLAGRADELLIDWGEVPPGSIARIYWPAAASAQIVQAAARMYGAHPLTAADPHTIEMRTLRGITFVPIPESADPALAGLLTIDLPQTVTTGQQFDVVIRRLGKRPRFAPPPILTATRSRRAAAAAAPPDLERYVVSAFQIRIPVSTSQAMLPPEQTTLAILKARLDGWPKTNRWYPVLQRYVDQIANRVDALGGNAAAIPPNLGGYLPPPHHHPHDHECTGKICELVFDPFGDLTGFILDDGHHRHRFESCEPHLIPLLLHALKARLTLTVLTTTHANRIHQIRITP